MSAVKKEKKWEVEVEKKMGKEKLCVGLLFLVVVHEDICCAVGENNLLLHMAVYLCWFS